MRVLFMRHAHSVSQIDRSIVVGRAFEKPLSEVGRAQAAAVAERLRGANIGAMYTSNCVRAVQTAETIGGILGIAVQPDDRLIERSHGDLEGKKKDDVYTPELVAEIHRDQLAWKPKNGESLQEVQTRLSAFLEDVAARPRDGQVLCVTHLMVLWALFHLCTQCDHAILPALSVENANVVEFEVGHGKPPTLVRWNSTVA